MSPYVFSKSHRSGEGWRVIYGDASGPTVSIWGLNRQEVHAKAQAHLHAIPEPIDAILQATLWHGRRSTA